jgi:protein-L-isoaspartate O-methyltransferase
VLPPLLGNQLVTGGCVVIPVGKFSQDLWVYRKNDDGSLSGEKLFAVRFVPLLNS